MLTCERTMASTYHGNTFFGFSACLPRRIIPDWLYYPILCPSGPVDKEKRLKFSSYGLRKVEAALLASGFSTDEVIVAHPDHLRVVIGPDTKINT